MDSLARSLIRGVPFLLAACSGAPAPTGGERLKPDSDAGSRDFGHACDGDSGSFEILFHPSQLPDFYLEVPEESWATISDCTRDESVTADPAPECDYQVATFQAIYDPDPADDVLERCAPEPRTVGLRRKGRATWRSVDAKPSWKVRFTAFDGEPFLGLSRLTLNNLVQDPSGMRERLGYELFRAADLPAPLANNARVFLKVGDAPEFDYAGLHSDIQTLDKQFVRYRIGDLDGQVGNLYDTVNAFGFTDLDRSSERQQAGLEPGAQEARFQLETNESENDTSDLTRLIDAVYVPEVTDDVDTLLDTVGAVADIQELLRAVATMAIVGDWDGFAGARNNYKVYRDVQRDRFVVIPWGIDQIFGGYTAPGTEPPEIVYHPNWGFPVDFSKPTRSPALFVHRCLADAERCAVQYRSAVEDVRDVLVALELADRVQAFKEQIEPLVDWDRDQFERHVAYVEQFLRERASCVRAQLEGTACAVLECPVQAHDCITVDPVGE